MYDIDPNEKAVVGGRERQWIAVAQTEVDCLKGMAYCLGELGRVPPTGHPGHIRECVPRIVFPHAAGR